MTLQELRYLVALADENHFARAAQACHVGQPTLSTQLRKLESELGVTLFERSNRRVLPTPVGEFIVAQARIVLDEAEKIRELARRDQDPMAGRLRLGAIPTLGPYLLPRLIPRIRAAFPDLRLLLHEDLTGNLLEQLRIGRLDAVLAALPVVAEGVRAESLFREPFELAVPSGHALATKARIEESDLVGENVLLLQEGHCLREQALSVCGAAVNEQGEEVQATSLETLRQMVAAGVGCTLLPVLATARGAGALQQGLIEMRPFAEPVPTRTIGLLWRSRYPRQETVKQLAALIQQNVPAELLDGE